MEMQAPTASSGMVENTDPASLGYQAPAQQNQQAMTRPSRRQLSYGQAQNEMSREQTNKLQTASN